jgi:glutathione peroxidase-family protein
MQDPDVHKFWIKLPDVCTLTTIYETLEELYSSYEPAANAIKAN